MKIIILIIMIENNDRKFECYFALLVSQPIVDWIYFFLLVGQNMTRTVSDFFFFPFYVLVCCPSQNLRGNVFYTAMPLVSSVKRLTQLIKTVKHFILRHCT